MASIKFAFLWLLIGASLCLPYTAIAQQFQLQTEAMLTLSISQEADEAIDRAERWLAQQAAPAHRVDALLRAYALSTPDNAPFRIARCDITPLEYAMPTAIDENCYTNFTATVECHRANPKHLFALQRDIPQENPPANWRETIALALINTQKITAKGGHWNNSSDETVWAILALRALLNESIPVKVE